MSEPGSLFYLFLVLIDQHGADRSRLAMKRFGKLRQWTDEKLGASQKTIATEEFRDLEAEMTLRQQGLESILVAMSHWLRALGKKKEGHDKVKGTPLDLLGIAMVSLTFLVDVSH